MNRPSDVREHEGQTDTEHTGIMLVFVFKVNEGMLRYIHCDVGSQFSWLARGLVVQCCLGALFLGGIFLRTLNRAAVLCCFGVFLQHI